MNIVERIQWEDQITLLTRQQRVEGGQNGAANIQAKELANRTAWLKSQLESIPDYREFTFYTSEDDPDGTISALEKTPNGKIFRILLNDGMDQVVIFRYYINNSGTAHFINELPSLRAVEKIENKLKDQLQNLFLTQHVMCMAVSDLSNAGSEQDNDIRGLFIAQQLLTQTSANLGDKQENQRLNSMMSVSMMGTQLSQLDGFDPKQAVSTEALIKAVESYFTTKRAATQYFLPTPSELIRIDIKTPSVPNSKSDPDVKGNVRITVGGAVVSCLCTISVQGATSAKYPKKNFNIKFFADEEYKNDIEIKLGHLLPHDRLVFKANWVDASHIRNALGYQIWQQMVNTRPGWPRNETENSVLGEIGSDSVLSGANGTPVLYPSVLYINNDFYGIGSFGTAKRYKNYSLEKNSPLQIHLDNNAWHTINTFAESVNTGAVEVDVPSKVTEETLSAINAWDVFASAVMKGNTDGWENYIDRTNITDFYLLCQLLVTTDLLSSNNIKNVQIISYDGKKWYFMPYDLDTCLGMQWDGKSVSDNSKTTFPQGSFWSNIIKALGSEQVEARYAMLRRKGVFSMNGLTTLVQNMQTTYSKDLFDAEQSKWPDVPSTKLTSANQILSWFNSRIEWLDSHYSFTD